MKCLGHLSINGSSEGDYYPFGMLMPDRNLSYENYHFGYQGSVRDDEIKSGGNSYTTEFRELDPRLGRWWSLDPDNVKTPWESPYAAMSNSPLSKNDILGNSAGNEYDPSGKKISNLGGDKIDFFHQTNGDTKIVDKASGASNIISGGESLIQGFTLRDNKTSWSQITGEFLTGKGPEKSLFADIDDSKQGPFKSLESPLSTYGEKARKDALSSNLNKNQLSFNYTEANPMEAKDMWEQMWGRTNISWYKLGDKTLFLMTDSKSATSLFYRQSNYWERSTNSVLGNTYQTYIWLESDSQIKQEVNDNNAYYQKQIKLLNQEIKLQKY